MGKQNHVKNLAQEVEGHFLEKCLCHVYQSSRKLNSKLSPQTTTVCGCLRHPSELSRSGCEPMTHGLSAVLAAIWQFVTIPLRPYGSVVIPSGKRRGVAGPPVIREALHCSTARVVVLILQRSPTQWKLEQSIFAFNKFTRDHILVLWVTGKRRHETHSRRPCDFERNSDSAHWINSKQIYLYCKCCKAWWGMFIFSPENSRVNQSFVLAQTFFSTCMVWVMGKAVIQRHGRTTRINIRVTDLDCWWCSQLIWFRRFYWSFFLCSW